MTTKAPELRRIDGGQPLDAESSPFQTSLFLSDITLAFVSMRGMTASRLSYLLSMRPARLVDCRPAPRFDYAPFDRRTVFLLLDELEIVYEDVGRLDLEADEPPSFGATSTAKAFLAKFPTLDPVGPNMILCLDWSSARSLAKVLPHLLEPRPKRGWDVAFP